MLKAAGTVSIEQVGVKQKSENKRKDTLWKRTLEEVSTNGERMLIIYRKWEKGTTDETLQKKKAKKHPGNTNLNLVYTVNSNESVDPEEATTKVLVRCLDICSWWQKKCIMAKRGQV